MIYSSESNGKVDYVSFGVLALYLLHTEMDGRSPFPLFGHKAPTVNPEGNREDPPPERPPSRGSLVVSPWFVVDDVVSIATSKSALSLEEEEVTLDDDGDSTEGLQPEGRTEERSDTPYAEPPTEPELPTFWGRFLTPVFHG